MNRWRVGVAPGATSLTRRPTSAIRPSSSLWPAGYARSTRQDCDGVATGRERRTMGGTFNAVRTARNYDPLGGGQVGGERPGDVLAVGESEARAPVRVTRSASERARNDDAPRVQSTYGARSPRSPSERGHSSSPGIKNAALFVVPGGGDRPGRRCPKMAKCPPPDVGVNLAEARHGTIHRPAAGFRRRRPWRAGDLSPRRPVQRASTAPFGRCAHLLRPHSSST